MTHGNIDFSIHINQMNLFRLILGIEKYPIRAAVNELIKLNELPRADFLENQEKLKWKIYTHHIKNNEWYKQFVRGTQVNNWEDIPIMKKSDIQRPLQEVLSPDFKKKKQLFTNNTSGSTGKPFHFAKDKFCHAMTWAYIFRRYAQAGISYGESLQARFFGIPLSRRKFLKEKFKDFLAARVRFPIFDLSDALLQRYLDRFYKRPFIYIYGYTSSLVLFAKYVIQNEIVLNKVCRTLRYCIVTSEVCSEDDKLLLEKGFGVNVINEYGAAELDLIAFTDNDGDWIINEENLFVEVVNEAGRPVEDGHSGRIVITSLYNKAMPFIRYNLEDIVSLKPHRKNGKRMIDTMEGRINDVALLPSGKKSPGLTFYYISKSLLEESGFMREFTIKQLKPDLFHFDYVADDFLTEDQQNRVRAMMDLYLEPGLQVIFERKATIERTGAGKFKHFQYLVKDN